MEQLRECLPSLPSLTLEEQDKPKAQFPVPACRIPRSFHQQLQFGSSLARGKLPTGSREFFLAVPHPGRLGKPPQDAALPCPDPKGQAKLLFHSTSTKSRAETQSPL